MHGSSAPIIDPDFTTDYVSVNLCAHAAGGTNQFVPAGHGVVGKIGVGKPGRGTAVPAHGMFGPVLQIISVLEIEIEGI